jgi:hypothetical protein
MLKRVVLNLNQKEYNIGLSYIIVLYIKALSGLIFKGSFNFNQFAIISSITFNNQELDYHFKSA